MSPHPFVLPSSLLLLASTAIAQITPGNLIVVRSGDGSATLSSASTAMFLDEYDRSTAAQLGPIQTVTMPITISGSATSEGFLTQSADGRYLIAMGYGVAPGTLTVANTAGNVVPRVVASIALDETIDATTALTDTYWGGAGAGNPRSAVSTDGSVFWTAGTGEMTGNRGVCFTVLGGTTSTQLATAPTNCRVAGMFNDQLFVSTASSGFNGVSTVGTGLPTTAGQTVALLNGFSPPVGTPSPYDYWFADAQTLYVADDRAIASGGGIQKWTESGGLWTLQYTINPGTGCRGLSGIKDLSGTWLYATTTQSSANRLVSALDVGVSSTFTILATAPASTAFRGVRFVRQPYNVTVSGVPCPSSVGTPTVGTTGGAPISGNANFTLTVGNLVAGFPYITVVSINAFVGPGFPLSFIGGPACALLYTPALDITLSGTADGFGVGLTPLPLGIPDAALWGLDLAVQHAFLDPLYLADALPFGTTEALQIEIGS